MKKPYLQKLRTLRDVQIWRVNGNIIRNSTDIEFTNFGQHYRFPFIPRNELWVDREYTRGELRYFIPRLLLEHRLMSRGSSYKNAITEAGKLEARLRGRDMEKKFGFRIPKSASQKERALRAIHKKLISPKGDSLKIWIVRGELVRNFFYIDFTQGGHEYVYRFVPKKEIWIDDDLFPEERKQVLLHELHERYLMGKMKLPYFAAHRSASALEKNARNSRSLLAKKLIFELNRNKRI